MLIGNLVAGCVLFLYQLCVSESDCDCLPPFRSRSPHCIDQIQFWFILFCVDLCVVGLFCCLVWCVVFVFKSIFKNKMMFLHCYHHCHYHHDHYRVLASPVLRRDVDVDVCVLAYDHDQCCNLGQGPLHCL